jgi:GMP synthase (glutamine-hydrolysing)
MKDFIQKEIVRIRHLVGETAQVIGAVSGGVDSTVAAKLMKEAIGTTSMVVLLFERLLTVNFRRPFPRYPCQQRRHASQ